MNKSLASCSIGEEVVVTELLPSDLSSKLLEMGIYSGKKLQIVYTAPFGGPVAVNVGSYVLSMRKDEAGYIMVTTQATADEA